MQIKVQKKSIVGIRTTYSADAKRGVPEKVVSVPSWINSLDSLSATTDQEAIQQVAALRDDERQQLIDFLAERAQKLVESRKVGGIQFLRGSILQGIESLQDPVGRAALDAEKADKLWHSIRDLQQALTAAGFKRPKFGATEE